MKRVDTLVIGAGIAGLTAAWHLQKSGRDVLVIEAAEQVGGRMATERKNGFIVDTGAQFLSTGYRLIPGLCQDCGLIIEPTACADSAISYSGRARRVRAGRVWDPLTNGLLGPRDWFRLGRLYWRHRAALGGGDLSNFSQWAPFDTETSQDWVLREAGPEVLGQITEPLLEGLYFQQPETTSKALVLMISGFAWRGHRTTTLRGGMGALPQAMAARLPVCCGEPAINLHEEPDGVRVQTSRSTIVAHQVVCAVPASQARQLWPTAPELERNLMATTYSATINIALMLSVGFRLPPSLRKLYGMVIPRGKRQRIAALAIEGNKCRDRAATGELIIVMLSDAAASTAMCLDEGELWAALQPELERYLPGATKALVGMSVYRWPQAEPRSPVGRASTLRRYRAPTSTARWIYLAGDYVGAPYTEGAAETGTWAAAQIIGPRP
jgi:oxygen-dependent protoporphyrinogen oxidase